MTVKDLESLYDYGYWATRKLFHVSSQLTPDQFTQEVAGSYGSIRNTMVHILSAEWGWLSRCGGPERGPALKPADFPTLESLVSTWSKVEGYVREVLSKLKDEDLARDVEYPNPQGENAACGWESYCSTPLTTGFIIVDRLLCYFGCWEKYPAISMRSFT